MTVGPETVLYTLLGDPVAHSLSPLIHNTAFEALSVDAVYAASRVEADGLSDAIRGLAALGFRGANVTIPHKLAVMDLLDDVTETARVIGAVNAVRIEHSAGRTQLTGDNTDAAGFAEVLIGGDDWSGGNEAPRSALILGAGGSSRAVVYACLHLLGISRVAVTARRKAQADELSGRFGGAEAGMRVIPWQNRTAEAGEAELIVNCTPLGMHPEVDGTALEDLSSIGSGQTVYDLVYAPSETRLLRESRGRGARTISGIEMLIGQAAVAFEWWTGHEMPAAAVRKAVRRRTAGT